MLFLLLSGISVFTEATSLHQEGTLAETLSSQVSELSEQDFLQVPFDPVNNELDKKMFEEVLNDPSFLKFRASRALLFANMDLVTYDRLHRQYLNQLTIAARNVGVHFDRQKHSYNHVLSMIESASAAQQAESPSFVDVSSQIQEMRHATYLFEARSTLMDALQEDAIIFDVSGKINGAIDWLVGQFQSKKCSWCQQMVTYVKENACQKVRRMMSLK